MKKYRRHKDYKRYSRPIPGERVQIDVTKITAGCYQYTAIDDCTRLKVLRIFSKKNADSSINFLNEIIDSFGDIGFAVQRIQSDNGKEFYNYKFQYELLEHRIKFRPIPPASPHLNGKVERGQKTDKEEFYRTLNLKDSKLDLTFKLKEWEHFYNYSRPHSSLKGKTPYEKYLEVKDKVPHQFDVFDEFTNSDEQIKDYELEKLKRRNPEIAKLLAAKMSHMS
jgi:transposase InsO family protein